MAQFLVEAYLPRGGAIDPAETIERVRAAVEQMSSAGAGVRHLRSIVVPGDETCFHVFEAHSIEAVQTVGRRAQLEFDRVTEAIEPAMTDERE